MRITGRNIIAFLILALILDVYIWFLIFTEILGRTASGVYFLDVGQGDSELVVLENGVKILIDGGSGTKILDRLAEVLPPNDRYLDLVILSHPQLDHFGGLIDVIHRYGIGAFIFNGRSGGAKAFNSLMEILEENKAQTLILREDDKILYQNNVFEIISPSPQELVSEDLNDTSLVIFATDGNSKLLFTGDIGFRVEDRLVKKYDLNIDILKVAHHGSKYSTSVGFLKEVTPAVSIIEVGRNNYGHPAKETLSRLDQIGSKVYRTDVNSTVYLKF